MELKLKNIAIHLQEQGIDHRIVGDRECTISGFSSIDNYRPGSLTWIKTNDRILEMTDTEKKQIVAIAQEGESIAITNGIYTKESKRAFFQVIEHFFASKRTNPPIGPGCYISEEVAISENVVIGANCVLDGEISIGSGTVIEPGVIIINRVEIGQDCYIQAGVCIGIDGYGYTEDDQHNKTMVRHYGGVLIGDRVFIGSHTNIARGTIDNTVISDGVKIAPSTHIGHNNIISDNASIVCSTLYGSVKTGRNAYVSASIVRNQITIGENSIVGMGSLVTKNVENNVTVIGSPARVLDRSKK